MTKIISLLYDNNMENRLKEILIEKKIKQQTVANNTNLTKATISNYVNNKRQPNCKNMLKIANFLNLKVEDIWGLKNEND